jgi:hypothetical protein
VSDAAALLRADRAALARALLEGCAVDPASLEGFEYRGTSLGLPGWVEALTWKVFVKTFHRDPGSGHLRGWNVRIRQDDPRALEPVLRRGEPLCFGHYRVVDPAGYAMPVPAKGGLLLDYGLGGNRALDPTSLLRDPLVALEPGNADRLLGWSYLDLGRFRVGTPSYFLLERHAPIRRVVDPPAPRT